MIADEAPVLSNDEVVGLWCQYWIAPSAPEPAPLTPRADTAQYLFLPDGRFAWRAQTSAGSEPRKQAGTWRVSGAWLLLSDAQGQVIEQLAIADCPSNPEAEQLDARYRCRSLGGQAFWLSKPVDAVDVAQYLP